jgi:hypothetical protein
MTTTSNMPPHPNQWYTPVEVRVYDVDTDTRTDLRDFGDLQEAWLWVKHRMGDVIQEPDFLKPFQTFVDDMLHAYQDGGRGSIFAELNGFEFAAFYQVPRTASQVQ